MKGLCCAIVLAFGLNAMFLQEGTPQKPQEDSQSSVPAKPAAPLQAPKDASSKSQYGSPSSSGERAARFRSALNRGQAELMAHPVVAAVVLWIIGFSCFWAVLLLIYPLALLVPLRVCASVSEVTWRGLKVPLEHAIILSPFVYRERVLDRWIASHIEYVRAWFAGRDTVAVRSVWVDLPVKVERSREPEGNDDTIFPKLSPDDLRPYFRQRQLHMLIYGDGGVGKTSLACQIARWAMAEERSLRLRPHLMIPVLLESDFVREGERLEDVTNIVRQQIKEASGSTKDLPEKLSRELWSAGRVLIIVDGLSERSAAVRNFLKLQGGAGPLRYVLFTSRTEENEVLRQVAPKRLRPMRLQGDDLWDFVRSYLNLKDSRARFSDRELMDLCERLSDMAGDRDITAMLATMYTGMEVARKKGKAYPDQPRDIPDLMLNYVKQISERAGYIS